MNISLIADSSVFQSSILEAEMIGTKVELKGLNSPLDAAAMGRFDEAWDEIKAMLRKAIYEGKERAIPIYENAQKRVEELVQEAGSKSRDIETLLIARLRQYQSSFIDGMLEQVKSEIKVGNSTMSISQVQLNQKITLGGSLKASLAEAFALSSAGELQLEATYTNPVLVKPV